jgi:hypothetical protein
VSEQPTCEWESDNAGWGAPADFVILTGDRLVSVCRDCMPSFRWDGYEVVETL